MAIAFPTAKPTMIPGYPLRTILERSPVKGDIGIEIEVEGSKLPKEPDELNPWWAYHKDGSLRGEDNAEYVLKKPILFNQVPEALDALWALFGKYKSRLDESNRTSVHIHLNCQEFYLNRLTSFLAIYTCFEEVLTEWCGDHRVGNLFCLRAKDAPGSVYRIKKFIQSDGRNELNDGLHYSGLNTHALTKFGSVEIRALRGCSDPATIQQWVGILQRIYDASGTYQDPRTICDLFSQGGPTNFFETILGEWSSVVRKGVSMSEPQIRDSMYEGIRLAQDLCYCRDWDLFKPVQVRADPFGRSSRRFPPPEGLNPVNTLYGASAGSINTNFATLEAAIAGVQATHQGTINNPFNEAPTWGNGNTTNWNTGAPVAPPTTMSDAAAAAEQAEIEALDALYEEEENNDEI